MNIYCCCLHKVNKLVEIKNAPRDLLTNVIKGKLSWPSYSLFITRMQGRAGVVV